MGITVNDVEITDQMIEDALPDFQDAPHPVKAAVHALVMRELLVQQADKEGISGHTADEKIDQILAKNVQVPLPNDDECKRFYDANPQHFVAGELAEASHILFQVTDGVSLDLLRAKAQGVLETLQAHPEQFAALAQENSNCPSSAQGGSLGQFGRGQMVPEFEQAVFNTPAGQLVPKLVETRFGLHIIQVGRKADGSTLPFDKVQERIADYLQQSAFHRAVHQYLQILVGQARIDGVVLEGADSPLVQ